MTFDFSFWMNLMILYCFFRLSVQSTQNGLRGDPGVPAENAVILAFANRLTADDADSFVSPPAANEWIGLLQTTGFALKSAGSLC